MDFPQQLEACVKAGQPGAEPFYRPTALSEHSRGRNHAVWRIISGKRLRPSWFMPLVICSALAQTHWTHPLPP